VDEEDVHGASRVIRAGRPFAADPEPSNAEINVLASVAAPQVADDVLFRPSHSPARRRCVIVGPWVSISSIIRGKLMRSSFVCLALLWAAGSASAEDALPKGAAARLGKAEKLAQYAAVSTAFSPDNALVAWVTTGTGRRNTVTVHVWDVAGREEKVRCTFTGEDARATTAVAFADRGKLLLLGTYHEQGGPAKSTRFAVAKVRVWDVKTGKEIDRFPGIRTADTGEFQSLAAGADGKSVITQRDYEVQVWDLATGKLKRRFAVTNEDEGGFFVQAIAPGGQLLARRLNNDPLRLWDVATGKKRHELKDAGSPLALSGDGKRLATADGDKVLIWDADKGKEVARLKGSAVSAVFSSDGKRLAWAEKGGKVRVCEVAGKEVAAFEGAGGVLALSSDGKTLATVCPDGTLLLWAVPGAK
jgi:WD40 repeat protein